MANTASTVFRKAATALKSVPREIVAIELTPDETRAVRLQRSRDGLTITAAARLESVLSDGSDQSAPELALPSALKARHAAFSYSGPGMVTKVITLNGAQESITKAKVADAMGGMSTESHRMGYRLVRVGPRRQGHLLLASAVPEQAAATIPRILPAGRPVPYALEAGPVSLLTDFLVAGDHTADTCACVHFDTHTTVFAFLRAGVPLLVRTMDLGSNSVLARIQRKLGVDRETADGIIMAGAFDVSAPVRDVMAPLLRQLMLSRDFVERHENSPVTSIHVCGGGVLSSVFTEELSGNMRIEALPWDPLKGLRLADGAIKEEDHGHEWRYATAIGCAIGATDSTPLDRIP